jgi:hypothetical protein
MRYRWSEESYQYNITIPLLVILPYDQRYDGLPGRFGLW